MSKIEELILNKPAEIICFCLLSLIGFAWMVDGDPPGLTLNSSDAKKLGLQIWKNECAAKKEGLTSWNEGEEFASLGIGHFIWYPVGKSGHFKETFPDLIRFLEDRGAAPPEWIKQAQGCPWQTREEFQLAQQEPAMQELRDWLFEQIDLQTVYIINRLEKALPAMTYGLPEEKQRQIANQFYRLANTPAGVFALIDYLNFKGEGTARSESYHGFGWGLLQVLEGMEGSQTGRPAVEEFVHSAKEVLDRRIQHSPPERKEERWRNGWFNRLDSY